MQEEKNLFHSEKGVRGIVSDGDVPSGRLYIKFSAQIFEVNPENPDLLSNI